MARGTSKREEETGKEAQEMGELFGNLQFGKVAWACVQKKNLTGDSRERGTPGGRLPARAVKILTRLPISGWFKKKRRRKQDVQEKQSCTLSTKKKPKMGQSSSRRCKKGRTKAESARGRGSMCGKETRRNGACLSKK